MDRCEQCGYVFDEIPWEEVAPAVLSTTAALAALLARDGVAVRRRPAPTVWSALEYACHVRDVLLVQRERMYLALVEEQPVFAPMYRDRRAEVARYRSRDPQRVAGELRVAAGLCADVIGDLDAEQRRRTCVYNYPAPTVRTLAWLGAYTLHECVHHLLDARESSASAGVDDGDAGVTPIEMLDALTLVTADMAASVAFYTGLGFQVSVGGAAASFTTYTVGAQFLNVQLDPTHAPVREIWGRAIFWVDDVDAMHARALDRGYRPLTEPADASWGERYFHIHDPDGHELSFARPLEDG